MMTYLAEFGEECRTRDGVWRTRDGGVENT